MRINILLVMISLSAYCFAQKENVYIDKGNKAYQKNDYAGAENNYKNAITDNPSSVAGNYNLGNTYYQQQKYDESINQYNAIAKSSLDPGIRAKAYHNMGNT